MNEKATMTRTRRSFMGTVLSMLATVYVPFVREDEEIVSPWGNMPMSGLVSTLGLVWCGCCRYRCDSGLGRCCGIPDYHRRVRKDE
jgi:hypothetical protein